ncbi:hypothetical protein AB6A40_010353 [Gnathostoma spinigerum]|uniref:Uncharacterized protein n=1 Tax=Gnathostoma spinigerum TaxID=75299 RepID=A0ABD6F1D6_9BILA
MLQYEREKKISQRQDTLQGKVRQLEAAIQNYQLIEKQLVEHKRLLRASEFYALLNKDCERDTKEKMKEYLAGGDQLDLNKFLDLSQSQTFSLKKELKKKIHQLNAAEERNFELSRESTS